MSINLNRLILELVFMERIGFLLNELKQMLRLEFLCKENSSRKIWKLAELQLGISNMNLSPVMGEKLLTNTKIEKPIEKNKLVFHLWQLGFPDFCK